MAGGITFCKSFNIACEIGLTAPVLKIYLIEAKNVQAERVLPDFLCQVNVGLGQNRNRLKHGGPLPSPTVSKTSLPIPRALCTALQRFEKKKKTKQNTE